MSRQALAKVIDDVIADETRDETRGEGVGEQPATPTESEVAASGTPEPTSADNGPTARKCIAWPSVVAYRILPAWAFVIAVLTGYFTWQDASVRAAEIAGVESVQAATDGTIKILSYRPDSVEQLNEARTLLTGEFQDSYSALINDVVIPGAVERQISAQATVRAAASVSADSHRAVVLLFVNQMTTMGQDPPTDTASSVKVTLDKVGNRWLISDFTPV